MVFSVYCLVSLFLVENTLFFYERLAPFSFDGLLLSHMNGLFLL